MTKKKAPKGEYLGDNDALTAITATEEKKPKPEDRHGIPYAFGNRRSRREIRHKLSRKENMGKQVHLSRAEIRQAFGRAQP